MIVSLTSKQYFGDNYVVYERADRAARHVCVAITKICAATSSMHPHASFRLEQCFLTKAPPNEV
jgi:hypothetical protein